MDIYSTRAQLAAIDMMPREYSALFDFFCRDAGTVEDEKAIWDYRKGSRRMAPTVHPNSGDVPMMRDGYETREIGFCTIAPSRTIMNNDLKGRSFGENVLGAMTPQERENPSILNSSRKKRIAAGAGLSVVDVNRLLKSFEGMQQMVRQLSGKNLKKFQRGGGFPGMPGMFGR